MPLAPLLISTETSERDGSPWSMGGRGGATCAPASRILSLLSPPTAHREKEAELQDDNDTEKTVHTSGVAEA